MNDSIDIKNKEKSLSELMVRILKEPLNPIECAMNEVLDVNSDLKKSIEEVALSINTSIDVAETNKKSLLKVHDLCIDSDSKLDDFRRVLLGRIDDYQAESRQYVDDSNRYLGSEFELLRGFNDVVLKEIQFCRDSILRLDSEFSERTHNSKNEILTEVKSDVSIIVSLISENLNSVESAYKSMEKSHEDRVESLNQKISGLVEEVVTSKSRLNFLMFSTSIFFVLILVYVSYDLWGNIY